ncbi:MAG: hypothetical protein HY744_10195 [Deltaproteobacteria bacterium]|nr:hypothetical protein [Deltaproteobacteria bacterium]
MNAYQLSEIRRSVAFGLALVAAGCDVEAPGPEHASRGLDQPPPLLLRVEATTSYRDGDGAVPIRTVLAEGTTTYGVARSASFVLSFDRFLLPTSVARQAICLRASPEPVRTLAECAGPGQDFLEPEYDPAGRRAVFRQRPGFRLAAATAYWLTVLVPSEISPYGFQAFDGASLGRTYAFTFVTGQGEADEPLPGPGRFCAAVACSRSAQDRRDAAARCGFYADLAPLGSCAGASCHGQPSGVPGPGAGGDIAMGLDLTMDEQILWQTAFGHTAHQTQQGPAATAGGQGPARFGRAMPIIDPDNPGNSYAVYKVLAQFASHESDDPALLREIERLRESVVVGLPMPAGQTLTPAEMTNLSAWIGNGTPFACP